MNDTCTKCGEPRAKRAQWYWVDSNAKPPVVYCPRCAAVVAPDRVAARAERRSFIARNRRSRGASA